MTSSQRGTRIGRARIRTPGADAAACAARCAAAVPSLDLEPAAMPPQSILCVRSLADPLPGGIDARSRQGQTRPLAWEAAMRRSIAGMLQRAARPIDGAVAASAEAVLFADEAEMLACAARDACSGSLSSLWWWRHLLQGASFGQVLTAWRRAPAYIPAAFESLSATGYAVGWVRGLTRQESAALLDVTLRAHALPSLADDLAAVWRGRLAETADRAGPPRATPAAARTIGPPTIVIEKAPLPWRGIVPAEWEQPSLDIERRTFAAVCIVLRRAPWLPRNAAFAPALLAHLHEANHRGTSPGIEPPAPRAGIAGSHAAPAPIAPSNAAAQLASDSPDPGRPPASVWEGTASGARGVPPAAVDRGRSASQRPAQRPARSGHESSFAAPRELRLKESSHTTPPSVSRRLEPHSSEPARLDSGARVDLDVVSSLAGAFFLTNVALDLGLYSHGLEVHQDLEFGVWRFVDLAARELLRDVDEEDPLWGLLLHLEDPAGDRDESPTSPDLPSAERDALLTRVRVHVDNLLEVEDAGSLLIRRRGRITRSPAHLDVHFSLDQHPVEIRAARLDRNPGWIPAAGVHVAFHFD